MRRADRLYRITDFLRVRRRTTAEWLARRLGVSVRTIYRDVADLVASGLPVAGAAGVGYSLRRSMDLPPLTFDRDELSAIALGLRFVDASAAGAVAPAAARAMAKVRAAVRPAADASLPLFVADARPRLPLNLGAAMDSVAEREICEITYDDASGARTIRRIWPLAVVFFGGHWTIAAWCERRAAFRNFRADRLADLRRTGERFADVEGRRLADYWAEVRDLHGLEAADFGAEL